MKKILIGFLIMLLVFFTVRTIRLRQLGKEAFVLENKSDLLADSIRIKTVNFDLDTAMINRANKMVKQFDTLQKKVDFWNLKM